MKSKTSKTKEKNFHVVNPKAAGIDIGSMVHYVAVSRELDDNRYSCQRRPPIPAERVPLIPE